MNLIVVFCLSFVVSVHFTRAYRALHPTGPPSVDDDADVFNNHASRSASSGVIRSSGSHSKHFRKNLAKCVEHPFPKAFLRPSAARFARAAFSRAVSDVISTETRTSSFASSGVSSWFRATAFWPASFERSARRRRLLTPFFGFIGVVGTTRERETRPWSFLL